MGFINSSGMGDEIVIVSLNLKPENRTCVMHALFFFLH